MAIYYVWSGATGTADGSSWANAFTTLATATTGAIAHMVAGDTLYVAHDHTESYAANTSLTFTSAPATNTKCIVVNRAGSVPPVEADVITTPTVEIISSGAFNLAIEGSCYLSGFKFVAASGSTTGSPIFKMGDTANTWLQFKDCAFIIGGTTNNALTSFAFSNSSTSYIRVDLLSNCQFGFGHVNNTIQLGQITFNWYDSANSILTGTNPYTGSAYAIPTTIFSKVGSINTDREFSAFISGVDFSNWTGSTLVAPTNTNILQYTFRNCKLPSSYTKVGGTWGVPGVLNGFVSFINCDASNNYNNSFHNSIGSVTVETTIKPISNCATDGTTSYTWNMTTVSGASNVQYLKSFEWVEWIDSVGSPVTKTIDLITDNVVLTNQDFIFSAEYLGTASSPLMSTVTNTTATLLGTPTNLTTSSTSWTTTGLTTPKPQEVSLTFTPQTKGYVRYQAKLAKPTTTVYINPVTR